VWLARAAGSQVRMDVSVCVFMCGMRGVSV